MKLKSHYYMARLLFFNIRTAAGRIYIRGMDAEISNDLYLAIVENEQAFLAGALGPDVYPDVLLGELRIHTQKNINSGLWLALMFEEFRNNYDYRTPEGKEVLAFIAGWTVHYACDVFIRTYINHLTGQKFYNDARKPPSSQEEKAFYRVVESCLEKKVAEDRLLNNAKVKAPAEFLKRFFIDDRRICFNSAGYRSGFFIKKAKEDAKQADSSKNKDVKSDKNAPKNETSKDNVTPDDIAMLDFAPESLDLLFLLGGIRRMFLLDENIPFEEQMRIEDNENDKTKINRILHLKKADKLIDAWLSMVETLACQMLAVKIDDKSACDTALTQFQEQLAALEEEMIALLEICSAMIAEEGIPQWLLDFLMRKNYLDMFDLKGGLPVDLGSLKGEITVKITGPSSPVAGQTNRLIRKMVEKEIPEMIKNIYKRGSSIIPTENPESALRKLNWEKEDFDELDKNLGNFGKGIYSFLWQNGTPVADALNLAKLCLIKTESFDRIVKAIYDSDYERLPLNIKYDFNQKKKKLGIVEKTTFPKATKRLRFRVCSGNPDALESCAVKIAKGRDEEEITVEKRHSFGLYTLFKQYREYTDIKSVTLKVKTGSSEEDKFVIAVEAENLRIKERWEELIRLEGTLKSDSDCAVVYSNRLENIEHSPPKVKDDDGVSHITISLTIKKKDELPELDFDIGVLSFVKSLEAGKEWMSLEKENPLYFYFLHKLMHLSEKCYR